MPDFEGQDVAAREVLSEPPTDVQQPKMYEGATYILGALAGVCALASAILVALGHPVPDGLAAMGLTATGGLVGLLTPRRG